MAEIGLAIFGGVAAANTFIGQFIQLSRSLHKMAKSDKTAPDDIIEMAGEMSIFAGLFETFLDVCRDDSKKHNTLALSKLIVWSQKAFFGLEKLLEEVEPLISQGKDGHDEYSFVKRVIAHMRWYFSKSAAEHFRVSLRVARESINGYTNVIYIKKINKVLKALRHIDKQKRRATEKKLGMSLEEYTKVLEGRIQNKRGMQQAIHGRLKRASANGLDT